MAHQFKVSGMVHRPETHLSIRIGGFSGIVKL